MKLATLANGLPLSTTPALLPDVTITGLTEDSRRVEPGMLFAALCGSNADGARYIADAAARGAAAILTGNSRCDSVSIPILRAANARQMLAFIAARFFEPQPDVVVAVTGTNGKTSVAAFLRQIWAALGKDAASLGTVGIVTNRGERPLAHTTPDPITLHRHLAQLANEGVTHLALEASSHGLAQHRLDGVRLEAGVFTNITRDHLDYHATFRDYLEAKLRLFSELLQPGQPAAVDADGPGADDAIRAARRRGLRVLTVGLGGDYIRLAGAHVHGFTQRLILEHDGKSYKAALPLPGAFQASNALVAAALAVSLGGSPEKVFAALGNLRGAKGRLEYAGETVHGATVFIDYAHTPDALAKALRALRPYATARLRVVFGCGGDRDPGKRPQMGGAASSGADAVYVTDDNPRGEDPAAIRKSILSGVNAAVEIANRAEAINAAVADLQAGDVLLVAGKGHETGQIVGGSVLPFSDHEEVKAALARHRSCARASRHG